MRMKCACVESSSTSYERLPNVLGLYSRENENDKNSCNEKQEELVFYNDDGSYQTVIVEKNLCASDLCQVLALKNRVAKDVSWTIVEHWVDFGLERNLEDHEEVLAVYRDMESVAKQQNKRFVFRKDFRKYEFFHDPQQFFPEGMVDFNGCDSIMAGTCRAVALQNFVANADHCPPVISQVWIREPNKQIWSKAYMMLKDKTLYLSYKVQVVSKFFRHCKNRDNFLVMNNDRVTEDASLEWGQLQVFGRLTDYNIYTTLNAKNQLKAPTEYGICLRSPGSETDAESDAGLCCLACESEQARSCWITAMRLAKYGKQLRENYRAFKNKQIENMSPREYNRYTVPNESVRSRVAMDFTGSVGRIVEDPKEAKAIAVAEGYSWKRRWRPGLRPANVNQGLESGIHITQPWFHSGMSRDQATALVTRHGTVDGVFLVRESRSNPGSFVLTFRCSSKVIHSQIQPVMDQVRDALCYTLDSGVTKFYDLLQLVEFYQLNAGCLPTRLTHYLVQSPTGPLYSDKPTVTSSF